MVLCPVLGLWWCWLHRMSLEGLLPSLLFWRPVFFFFDPVIDTVSTHVFQKIELALFLTYCLLNTMSIDSMALCIVADVFWGFWLTRILLCWLCLQTGEGLPKKPLNVIRTIRCWTQCWVCARNEGISTELELWLCTMGGGLWEEWGKSKHL